MSILESFESKLKKLEEEIFKQQGSAKVEEDEELKKMASYIEAVYLQEVNEAKDLRFRINSLNELQQKYSDY